MKKIFKYSFSMLAAAALLTSCLPDPADERLQYNGPTVVEFKNHTLGLTNAALDAKGILRSTGNIQTDSSRVINVSKRETDTVFVQLVGPQRTTETTLNFSLLNSSVYPGKAMAVEGSDFNIVTGNRSVTIPANSSRGIIVIDPLQANMTAGDDKVIGLKLEDGDEVGVAKNYDTFWIRLRK